MVNPCYRAEDMQNPLLDETQLYCSADMLRNSIPLLPEEEAYFASKNGNRVLPLRITPHYLKLIQNDSTGVLRRMAIPRIEELSTRDYETPDPLHEESFEKVPRCIHRYTDRVLVLITDACALYCRHCFRRRFTGENKGMLSETDIQAIRGYIESHPEVKELILSGGDPLMVPDSKLEQIFQMLGTAGNIAVMRISSRVPVVLPSRLTGSLVEMLSRYRPIWMVLHINHPAEVSPRFADGIRMLAESGIPLVSQTVLLKGVNDSVKTLAELFYRLIALGVKPYYLFQGDLAPGTSHLRVSLSRGLELFKELGSQISGLALPHYAVDLPDGGGKVRLGAGSIAEVRGGEYHITSVDGRFFRYPVEQD
jgi:lysine 2,3-aminomutase